MKISTKKILSARIAFITKLIIGIPFALLFALFFAVYLDLNASEEESYVVAAIVCLVGTVLCIWMIISGIKQTQMISACQRYAAILAGNPVISIEQLAAFLGQPSGKVRMKLQKMINRGYLLNIYIDHAKGTIVALTAEERLSYQPTVMVSCQACGGVTEVAVGEKGVCEYCGSPIYGA